MSWISDYDTIEDTYRFGLIQPEHLDTFEELIKEKEDGVLLDLGINTNNFYIEYRSGLCNTFVGLELDKRRSNNIKKGRPYRQFKNFHYIHSDAKHIPLKDNSVDVITILGLMGEDGLDNVTEYWNKYGLHDDINFEQREGTSSKVTPEELLERRKKFYTFLEKTQKERVKKMIEDSYRVLKEDGILIISNKYETSPVSPTRDLLESYFSKVEYKMGFDRYLLVCRKH